MRQKKRDKLEVRLEERQVGGEAARGGGKRARTRQEGAGENNGTKTREGEGEEKMAWHLLPCLRKMSSAS